MEIIGVDVGGRGPPADGPRPFGLDGIGAPRLATWAARVEDIDERVARAWAVACDPGSVRPMSRRLPDGTDLHWRLTAPSADSVEIVPFLIQWAENAPHPSTTSAKGCTLASFAAEHPVPERVTECLTALGVELKVSVSATPALVAIIEGPDGTVELR